MKKTIVLSFLFFTGLSLTAFVNHSYPIAEILYPEGYRHWTHVKSSIVGAASPAAPKYEGFTHIYANEKAMQGYRSGIFPDGAVIVFDVLESVVSKTGINEGERKFIDVMVKDSLQYINTGGWGFEEFDKNSKTIRNLKEDDKVKCYNCHATRKSTDHIFTSFRQ